LAIGKIRPSQESNLCGNLFSRGLVIHDERELFGSFFWLQAAFISMLLDEKVYFLSNTKKFQQLESRLQKGILEEL